MIDYLIIGQGIAGSVLSFKLIDKGYKVKVIDTYSESNATMASAGILNPITGRSYVKTWNVETLWDEALTTYKKMEEQFNASLVFPLELYRTIPTVELENNWCSRFLDDGYREYLDIDKPKTLKYKSKQYGKINQAYRIDVNAVKSLWRSFLIENNLLINERFDYEQIVQSSSGVGYKGIEAKAIIFAEGFQVINNPFFNYLPFRPSRGESITFKHKGLQEMRMVKNQYFVVPLGDDHYWSGGGYDNNNLKIDEPIYLEKIVREIESFYDLKIEEYTYRSGVRPAIRDRRPVIGVHPTFDKLYLFNGMGTKGASLSPYCANELIDLLSNDQNVDQDIDLVRFQDCYVSS
jgi:glycine/D-amino acid oxidase-like deaminating enzyme